MESANRNAVCLQPQKAEQSGGGRSFGTTFGGIGYCPEREEKQGALGLALDGSCSSESPNAVKPEGRWDGGGSGIEDGRGSGRLHFWPKNQGVSQQDGGGLRAQPLAKLASFRRGARPAPPFFNHGSGTHQREETGSPETLTNRGPASRSEFSASARDPLPKPLRRTTWGPLLNSMLTTGRDPVPESSSGRTLSPPLEDGLEDSILGQRVPRRMPLKRYSRSPQSPGLMVRGPYCIKATTSFGHFPEKSLSQQQSMVSSISSSRPLARTPDPGALAVQPQGSSEEATGEGQFLLIDDKGMPYTVLKKDLENPAGAKPQCSPEEAPPPPLLSSSPPPGPRKLHYCLVCFRTFLYLSDLERHSITHSEHKPFECKACGKTFKRSSHLQRHKHIHTGERPFRCAICLKGFRESGELLRHQRVHTGEKPYQCELCHLRFTERNTLRRHIKRKHIRETFYQREAGDSSDWSDTTKDTPAEDNTE
ncbi:zinc finger protein 629-like [Rhinatrema bivittatum]|uniref:zinc finger protein 629-like n=1 Tax=Rhinatrema bivittatum TaxID=194408 RepID=UPI0011297F49|nr:zinc finger protein 629-like [Rhinatrema bivittatum]